MASALAARLGCPSLKPQRSCSSLTLRARTRKAQRPLCPFGAVEYIVCSRQNNSRPAIGRSDATHTQCQEITPEEPETAAAPPARQKQYQRADQNHAGCR